MPFVLFLYLTMPVTFIKDFRIINPAKLRKLDLTFPTE